MARATKAQIEAAANEEADEVFKQITELLNSLQRCGKTGNKVVVTRCETAYAVAMLGHDVSKSPTGRCWNLDDLDLCDAIRSIACRNVGQDYLSNEQLCRKFDPAVGVKSLPSEE